MGSLGDILLADDDESLGILIQLVLDRRGYHVLTTLSGQEALAMAERRSRTFDLLITDVDMPLLSGLGLAQEFRKRYPGVPILFTSGGPDLDGVDQFILEQDRTSLLRKPFRPSKLLEAVTFAMQEETTPRRLRIVLAEDHEETRELLRHFVNRKHDIVRAVGNGEAVLPAVQELHPDFVLLDISMPGMSGFAVARQLRRDAPEVKIVFITQHGEPAYVQAALRSGAVGYVLKRCVATDLSSALKAVAAGVSYISPELAT
jgi:CheY-like chemotaxis protein